MIVSDLQVANTDPALELNANVLQQLDPAAEPMWLYPGLAQFRPVVVPAKSCPLTVCQGKPALATLSLHMPAELVAPEADYVWSLRQELAMRGKWCQKRLQINQFQVRATTLASPVIATLADCARLHFAFSPNCQYLIERNALSLTPFELDNLRGQGFTHLEIKQCHDGHTKPRPAELAELTRLARHLGFESVNIKLMLGLPQQTLFATARNLKQVIAAQPDLISLANHASDTTQLVWCIKRLHAANYYYLGARIFANQHHPLVRAQRHGHLQRNLFGYAQNNETFHIGCGVGAVNCLANYYYQNQTDFARYQQQLQNKFIPAEREWHLGMDDLLRRLIIHMLLCNFELSISTLEQAWPIRFVDYFATEIGHLRHMEAQQWLSLDQEWLLVQPRGRLFIEQICAVFDRYHRAPEARA